MTKRRWKLRAWAFAFALTLLGAPAPAQSPPSGGSSSSGGSVTQGTSPWVTTDQSTFAASIAATVTRPANTTTYTANTGWCNTTSACATVFTFANACRANGKAIQIQGVDIYSSANPATKLQGILWLFTVTPGTVINDDATFNIASADFANLFGGAFNGLSFTLASSQASGAANSGTSLTGLGLAGACAGGATTLYAMVQVVNAYVPASGEVLTVKLNAVGLN